MNKLKNLHPVSKGSLVVIIAVLVYFILLYVLYLNFGNRSQFSGMMQMMGNSSVFNFSDPTMIVINFVSLMFSLLSAFVASLYIFSVTHEKESGKIIEKMLSDNERKVVNEVRKAKEITQDSLRFRLNWSKAKISTILTNLDKKSIIQRERTGKTYKVRLQGA